MHVQELRFMDRTSIFRVFIRIGLVGHENSVVGDVNKQGHREKLKRVGEYGEKSFFVKSLKNVPKEG